MDCKEGQLEVYAIRNGIECKYDVESVEDARKLINALADADLKNDDIDFNMFGLIVFKDGEWTEWTDENGYRC